MAAAGAGIALALITSAGPPAVAGTSPIPIWPASTPTRPQLTPDQAAGLTTAQYLGDWTPRPSWLSPRRAEYTVDPAGAYPTVQSAIDAAVLAGGAGRVRIAVVPGRYREVVCVPAGAPPITLSGLSRNAADTVIVFDHANPTPKPAGTGANPCNPNLAAATYGTGGSATFAASATGFEARNLTFANDYVEDTYPRGNQSAVALSAAGDRQIYQNVRVLGNQDSLLANTPSAAVVARQYFRDSYVEGDTDFVFGRGTAVFDRVEVRYLSARKPDGAILAPSTAAANRYGFLFRHSRFTVDSPAVVGTVRLGRAWDESVGTLAGYVDGVSPNGQALIRDSWLGRDIRPLDPWGASTISRPFCVLDCAYSPNRLGEHHNVGPGNGQADH
jgi:pectinesterase